MKNNQPITRNEIHFSEDDNPVSTTDLKGIITGVSPAFCRLRGLSEQELLGRSHNIGYAAASLPIVMGDDQGRADLAGRIKTAVKAATITGSMLMYRRYSIPAVLSVTARYASSRRPRR